MHDYVSSISGRKIWAWREDDAKTWRVYVKNARFVSRCIAVISGTKIHAQVVVDALSVGPKIEGWSSL